MQVEHKMALKYWDGLDKLIGKKIAQKVCKYTDDFYDDIKGKKRTVKALKRG